MPTQTINLNNTEPAAPAGSQNVLWQADAPSLDPTVVRNVTAYHSKFVGDTGAGGVMGLVPAPGAGDAAAGKVLKADGTWYVPPSVALPSGPANQVLATPNGASGASVLRVLVPADLPVATISALGAVKPDGSSITIAGGVISAPGGGGGGGGGGGLWSGLIGTVPTQANTGLTTAYNQSGSFSAMDAATGILMADPTSVSGDWNEGVVGPYPSAPFVRRALITWPVAGNGFPTAFSLLGLVICNTLSGQAIFFGASCRTTGQPPQFWGQNYSSPTAFNSNSFTSDWNLTFPQWLILTDDGTTLNLYVTSDPLVEQVLVWSTTRAASYLGASGFNYLGFMITPMNGGIAGTLMAWLTS